MTRRTGLVIAGLAVLGASFGIGTAIATAQTTTPKTPSTTSPDNSTPSTPHTCPHHDQAATQSSL